MQRDLLCIRGTYCYDSVVSLDAALDDLRARLESEYVDPLAVRCWILDDATLEVAITVPMFTDHTYAARWCDLLASTALVGSRHRGGAAVKAYALAMLVACTPQYGGDAIPVDAKPNDRKPTETVLADAAIDAPVMLSPQPGSYRSACDGSAAAALDVDHLIGFSDNDQTIRVFKRSTNAVPLRTQDIGGSLALGGTTPKVDFEDVERVGDRIYAISSHGRKNDGNKDDNRYRFAAVDVTGQAPNFQFAVAGSRSSLLSELLASANWLSPDSSIIDALDNASKLHEQSNSNLAPKNQGVNIEGIAHAPTAAMPGRMLIGLRNPRPNGRAIVVALTNVDSVIAGNPAIFGEGYKLDLGNLGIRGMTWSPMLKQVLIVAGPHDDQNGPYKLYRWLGTPGTTPTFVRTIEAPPNMRPEGVIAYPGTLDIAIVFDGDDQLINNTPCDDAQQDQRSFIDVVTRVE